MSGQTQIMISDTTKTHSTSKTKKHKFFRHWAGVEPIIGYCWSDHRLGGAPTIVSSETPSNAILATAAFNFKRAMRLFCVLLKRG